MSPSTPSVAAAPAPAPATATVPRTDPKANRDHGPTVSDSHSHSHSQDCKDLADQYLQGLSQLSATSQSQSQSQSQPQASQPPNSRPHPLPLGHDHGHHHDHHDGIDNDSHSDTALAADAPLLAARHRESSSLTPPLSPTASTRGYPPPTSITSPNGRSGALTQLASAALQPRADPNALLAASSLSDHSQSSSQPLFDLPASSSATRPPPSPDMTAVPAAKPSRHPAIMPLLDAHSLHRTRSLEATLGVDGMLNPMDAYPDDIIPRASGFSQQQQQHHLQQSQQSQSRSALAGMPALKFESQLSSQGLSPLPYSTRAKTRSGQQFPPPSPTTPTSSVHQHRGTRMRPGFPLEPPVARLPPPGAATGDDHLSSPTSPLIDGYQQNHHIHAPEEPPSSLPASMYDEPMHNHHDDAHDNDIDTQFPVSQRSPSPLPYAGPLDPPHASSSDLSSDHQQHYPMSPFAHPPTSTGFSQHPYAPPQTSAPAHGAPLTRHRSRGLESAMGDMELDTDMDVDSRHSTPGPAAAGGAHNDDDDDEDDHGPFGRHHDAYATQHHQFNTQLPAGYGHAADDLEHDREAMDLMDLVPGPSTAHFASRTPFQRRGRPSLTNLPAPPPASSSVRDLSTAPPTSSRSGSPTGSRTSGTHATATSVSGMPVLIPSTTKKSHTNCRSLPAVLEYPDYLIPIDAPIQSRRGGAPAAAVAAATGRVTRARARNSAPAATPAETQVPAAGQQGERDGGSGSSSPAQPANSRKRKRVSAPSASTSASAASSSSAAALAFHAPPLPTAPVTPAPAPRPAAAAAAATPVYDDAHLDDDESAAELDGLDPREAKRIRNTISARRSRARKAAKIEYLERRVNDMADENAVLRADNDQLRELLVRHGIAVPPPPIAGAAARGEDVMDEE